MLYRLLFILYAEARDLLPVRENAPYRESYSLQALKRAIARDLDGGQPAAPACRSCGSGCAELWHVIDARRCRPGRAAYNGGLFEPGQAPLPGALPRRRPAPAPGHRPAGARSIRYRRREFVDYRDLEIRHLGSIYEGLLEYQLRVRRRAAGRRAVKEGKERYEPAAGAVPDVPAGQVYLVTDKGERKATGSYYTPDYIVQYIVEHTVGPVLAERTRRSGHRTAAITDEAGLAQAVLGVNVLDPAMGSGHFLVAATEYIARFLVELELADAGRKTKDEAPTDRAELAYWRRRVAQALHLRRGPQPAGGGAGQAQPVAGDRQQGQAAQLPGSPPALRQQPDRRAGGRLAAGASAGRAGRQGAQGRAQGRRRGEEAEPRAPPASSRCWTTAPSPGRCAPPAASWPTSSAWAARPWPTSTSRAHLRRVRAHGHRAGTAAGRRVDCTSLWPGAGRDAVAAG